MIKFVACLLFCLFFAAIAHAEPSALPQTSLFFTPGEARDAEALAEKTAPAGEADIRLGAVMYYGPNDWTLWLQGTRWTPQTSRDNLRVLGVTENTVRLSWRGEDDSAAREIILRPNEIFQIATGKIISSP